MKTYGADTGRYGTDRDGVERWWRHLIGGAAAVRFHRPDSGLGFSGKAEASIRAGRKLESLVKMWDVEPANRLLRGREENEAYVAARQRVAGGTGEAYAIYFPDGGAVELDLRGQSGTFDVRWIEVGSGEWGPRGTLSAGDWAGVSAPGPGPLGGGNRRGVRRSRLTQKCTGLTHVRMAGSGRSDYSISVRSWMAQAGGRLRKVVLPAQATEIGDRSKAHEDCTLVHRCGNCRGIGCGRLVAAVV